MKKTLFFLFVVLYCAIVAYLYTTYPEQKWIPRTILDLPRLNAIIEADQNYKEEYPTPETHFATAKDNDFNVVFDAEPLAVFETPWKEQKNAAKAYGKKVDIHKDRAIISVVLTGVGINEKDFQEAIQKLPPVVTLSFSPYALNLDNKVSVARQKGFENTFDLPVNTSSVFFEGGRHAVNDAMSAQEISQLLEKKYFNNNLPFVGFVAPMIKNESFTKVLSEDIQEKGLVFVDLEKAKTLNSDLFYREALDFFLQKIIQETPLNDISIVVLPLTPLTIEAIVYWIAIEDLPDVEFVPISEVGL